MKYGDEAKLIGITQGYWSAIRHKKVVPSLKLARRIEKVFPEYTIVRLIPEVAKVARKN